MWSIVFLAQLGANSHDPRIRRACEHLFDYAVAKHGGLSADGNNYGGDPRLTYALNQLLSKQAKHGRWPLEYSYNGKTWVDVEEKARPGKWVTLRAMRVLRNVA